VNTVDEKQLQETFIWERTDQYSNYNEILGYYQVMSIIENCKGSSVLDLACGDGFNTKILSKHFDTVVGVDASSQHLLKAKKRLPNVRFHESLIEDLNINDTFDCVTMINVLEHVISPKFVLNKAVNFLNENGRLVVHVPNSNAINRKLAVLMGALSSCDELSPFDINIAGHRRYYDLDILQKEIIDAGLIVESTGGVFLKMLSTPQMDWFLTNGLWVEGGFGWGRVGEIQKDWKALFCNACYELGKQRPADCNIIYAIVKRS
jgi:SAM-dependent methyltransferase